MLGPRALSSFALSMSAFLALSCGDPNQITSPVLSTATLLPSAARVTASFSAFNVGTKAKAVRWGPDHSNAEQSVSAIIDDAGGTLSLPGADFSLTIPAGALAAPTSITVIAKAGAYVAYEMQPHGLRFLKPVIAVQGLRTTATYGTDAGNSVRPAYLPEGKENIASDDSAAPVEVEASTTLLYGAKPVAESQEWILNHFSRYILISGAWVLVNDDH
ncbi:MAG: hypothetical protein ABI408_09350 [Gemmatimonadaceae bacterium]